MKVAIIGASGKTGRALIREVLDRGGEVSAVCRSETVERLREFEASESVEILAGASVADEALVERALAGADAAVAILVSPRPLRATDIVRALARAGEKHGVRDFAFTAGEVTANPEPGERFTRRQRLMWTLVPPLVGLLTRHSVRDMIDASTLIAQQSDWNWTIVRAPTLTNEDARGYRRCAIDDITGSDKLSRVDYARALLDSLKNSDTARRTIAVTSDR